MKKIIPLMLMLFIGLSISAQKYAFVDTKYILNNMPGYESAQAELDAVSETWQNEIASRYDVIEKLYKSYQAEVIIMTDEMKAEREEEIMNKEREAKALQKQRFGVEGDLFKKRQELILPIQEQIWDAIREYAVEGGYMAVFDKSSESGVLYANSKYDKSDKILRKMGIRPGEKKTNSDDGGGSSNSGSNSNAPRKDTNTIEGKIPQKK